MHPEFEAFVEYAFAVNAGNRLFNRFKLHTNAVIFPVARAQLLLRLAGQTDIDPRTFEAVHFSVDAWSPAAYAFVKGAEHGERVFRNVERFLALRGEAQFPVAHIAIVVQEGNRHEVRAFVDHWSSAFRAVNRSFRVTADWPPFDQDAIYVRRLNTGDQAAADAWHAKACVDAGISVQPRVAGSF